MKDRVKLSLLAPKRRELSTDEREALRSRIENGERDSYRLAAEFGCSVSQVAGVRAHVSRKASAQMAAHTTAELAPEVSRLRGSPALTSLMEHFHALMLGVVSFDPRLVAWVKKHRPGVEEVLGSSLTSVYLAVPGMYGGFKYRLTIVGGRPLLEVASWYRIEAGSGQAHEVSPQGSRLLWEEEPLLQALDPDEKRNHDETEPT